MTQENQRLPFSLRHPAISSAGEGLLVTTGWGAAAVGTEFVTAKFLPEIAAAGGAVAGATGGLAWDVADSIWNTLWFVPVTLLHFLPIRGSVWETGHTGIKHYFDAWGSSLKNPIDTAKDTIGGFQNWGQHAQPGLEHFLLDPKTIIVTAALGIAGLAIASVTSYKEKNL